MIYDNLIIGIILALAALAIVLSLSLQDESPDEED